MRMLTKDEIEALREDAIKVSAEMKRLIASRQKE